VRTSEGSVEVASPRQPKSGDVVIWDVEPEAARAAYYWVRIHSRGSATRLFDGPDAWDDARSAAAALAGPEGIVWKRHTDGHFELLTGSI